MTPMIAAVPPINTLSLETDPRRPASCWLELPVSLSDIVPPSSPCLSPPTARAFSSGRFGHDIPPSPSLAAITPPGCPGLRSRPLAETLILILPMLECRAQAGTEQCGQLPHPNNKFASDGITRAAIPVSLLPPLRCSLPYFQLRLCGSLFRVHAFPGERCTGQRSVSCCILVHAK